jgi:hypothetical protein
MALLRLREVGLEHQDRQLDFSRLRDGVLLGISKAWHMIKHV